MAFSRSAALIPATWRPPGSNKRSARNPMAMWAGGIEDPPSAGSNRAADPFINEQSARKQSIATASPVSSRTPPARKTTTPIQVGIMPAPPRR